MTDLAITRGDAYTGVRRLTVLVTDPNTTPPNDTVDLTAIDLTFLVKRRPTDNDDDALITKTVGAGITIADQLTDEGQALIAIAAADTDAGPVGTFYWELQGVDAVGVITLASGRIRIAADLVRET